MYWPWNELGLPGPSSVEDVKRAYAQRLKIVHPEEDPEGFQQLHRAYTAARRLAALMAQGQLIPPELREDSEPEETPKSETVFDFDTLLERAEEVPDPAEKEWQTAWAPPPPRRTLWQELGPGPLIFGMVVALVCLVAIPLLMPRISALFPTQDQRNARALMGYLEADFEVELVSSPSNRERADDSYLFWEKDDPDLRFQARPEGTRNPDQGQPGYHTNYTEALLYRAMGDFFQDWPEYRVWYDTERTDPDGAEKLRTAIASVTFLVELPVTGYEDFLSALSAQLTALSEAAWFTAYPPQWHILLAHGPYLVVERWSAKHDLPTRNELLEEYAAAIGPTVLRAVLQEGGGNWDYPDLNQVRIIRQGTEGVVLGTDCWWATCHGPGLDGAPLTMNYLLSKDFSTLYTLPQSALDRQDEIVFAEWDPLRLDCGCTVAVWRSEA